MSSVLTRYLEWYQTCVRGVVVGRCRCSFKQPWESQGLPGTLAAGDGTGVPSTCGVRGGGLGRKETLVLVVGRFERFRQISFGVIVCFGKKAGENVVRVGAVGGALMVGVNGGWGFLVARRGWVGRELISRHCVLSQQADDTLAWPGRARGNEGVRHLPPPPTPTPTLTPIQHPHPHPTDLSTTPLSGFKTFGTFLPRIVPSHQVVFTPLSIITWSDIFDNISYIPPKSHTVVIATILPPQEIVTSLRVDLGDHRMFSVNFSWSKSPISIQSCEFCEICRLIVLVFDKMCPLVWFTSGGLAKWTLLLHLRELQVGPKDDSRSTLFYFEKGVPLLCVCPGKIWSPPLIGWNWRFVTSPSFHVMFSKNSSISKRKIGRAPRLGLTVKLIVTSMRSQLWGGRDQRERRVGR